MSGDAASRARARVRPEVRALSAYQVGDARGLIKLDAMESPWPWPDREWADAWREALGRVEANRYPDPAAGGVKAALRRVMPVPQGAGLMLGNGSDELIQLLNLALAGAGRTVLAPAPSFAMYRIIATVTGSGFAEVELDEAFGIDVEATLEALRRHRPAVVYLAHPNNPTGNALEPEAVEAVIRAAEGVVVVDEAYYAYADHSFLPRVLDHPNLVVLRTLSKVGLAGLRVGVLAAHPAWVEELEKCRMPYNLGSLAQAGAAFALEHNHRLEAAVTRVRAERERLAAALAAQHGVLEVFPSATNFITFRLPPGRGGAVHEALRRGGVLIKNLHGSHPRLADCLRVTVGTPEENDAFLNALGSAFRGGNEPSLSG